MDIGIHWLRDPWGMLALPQEDRLDLLAYRETMIASDPTRAKAGHRARRGRATMSDLRVLSVGPMSEGGYLHARLLTSGAQAKAGAARGHQTTGEQQLAKILATRGGDGADYWRKKLMGGG